MSTTGIIQETKLEQIIWKISDFSSFFDDNEKPFCKSPSFLFSGESWHLTIYPNGNERKKSKGYISLYLWRNSSDYEISLDFSLGLKTLDGKNEPNHHRLKNFTKLYNGYGVDKCILRSELFDRKSHFLPNDTLTVYCNLNYPVSAESPSQISLSKSLKILQDFDQLFLKRQNCDVVFKIKEEEIPAHRAILTARSSVFESTFRNDMKEKLTGIINIEDFDFRTFTDFLHFLYSGDSSIIPPGNVCNLFTASDKYDVGDLREECVSFMKGTISVESFCDIITLALQHVETDLVNLCTNFFIKNAENITNTVRWQSFVAQNPTHSNELFIKFIKAVQHPNT